jgi:Domain of unknown function (DUF4193)
VEVVTVSKDIDYDSPRRSAGEVDEDSLEELQAHGTSAKVLGVDVDEAEAAENFELPGADLSGEELTGAVVPMQSDEFRCPRCFLVQHRSQLAAGQDGQQICRECAEG